MSHNRATLDNDVVLMGVTTNAASIANSHDLRRMGRHVT